MTAKEKDNCVDEKVDDLASSQGSSAHVGNMADAERNITALEHTELLEETHLPAGTLSPTGVARSNGESVLAADIVNLDRVSRVPSPVGEEQELEVDSAVCGVIKG